MEMPVQSEASPDTNDTNKPESSNVSAGSSSRRLRSSPKSARDSLSPRSIAQQMPCIGRGLYISGVGGVTNRRILEHQNITHVLNLARGLEDTVFPDFVDVRYEGLRDSEEEDLYGHLPGLVEHIHRVIDGGGRIVVNCVAGVSRSASVCLAYKVRYEGLSLREAFDEVHKARPVISPNVGFWQALVRWEEEVRGENSVLMLPYIFGMVPELESYKRVAELRVRLCYMSELLAFWTLGFVVLTLQIIAIVWG